jgi:hypothetical protein
MPHEFVILVDGKEKTFTAFEDIPKKIDNVIKFNPEIPEGPHSDEEHEEIHLWNKRFLELMARETNGN